MKIGLYPGTFNPWHEGHTDILVKALGVFDRICIVKMSNPEKQNAEKDFTSIVNARKKLPSKLRKRVIFYGQWYGLLRDYVEVSPEISGIIRGLRNGSDLQFEQTMQYWNEDLGIKIPTVYFICDRTLSHISSSAIRAVAHFDV